MRLFARYTDTRLYVRIFLRILIPFPIHLRVLLLSMSRLFNFYRENCVRGVSQLLCLHNESPFPFVMANVQGSERSLSMDLTISDDRVQQLAEVCKKRLNTMSAADHIKDRGEKVYVNRSMSMDNIKYIGFDMDHTLVVYKSPEYDILAYDMAVEKLVSKGYPVDIKQLTYEASFPVRGMLFDRIYGNLLKVDAYGNVLACHHGFQSLSSVEIRQFYPNQYVQPNHERIFHLDTLFHLGETYLLAVLVDFFDKNCQYKRVTEGPDRYTGVQCGDVVITYKMIQQDVRSSFHWAHTLGNLKQRTLDDLPRYVKKDHRLPLMLHRLKESGRKLFIATNSDYAYTQKIMTYMFDFPHGPKPGLPHQSWKNYFDYIIVDANKPLFFMEGTMLREVDETTGSLCLGMFTGGLKQGKIFSGGSSDAFCKYTGASGKQVLYVGDHIFGDIIKSKKEQAFRTFLVIPELTAEVEAWEGSRDLFLRLQNLELILAELYCQSCESDSGQLLPDLPSISTIKKAIKETAQMIEGNYPNHLGSLLRCGSRLTYFASQLSRFADLYSSTCVNLVHYPTNYLFSSPHQLMAHEAPSSENRPYSPLPLRAVENGSVQNKHNWTSSRGFSVVDIDMDEQDGNGFKQPSLVES